MKAKNILKDLDLSSQIFILKDLNLRFRILILNKDWRSSFHISTPGFEIKISMLHT